MSQQLKVTLEQKHRSMNVSLPAACQATLFMTSMMPVISLRHWLHNFTHDWMLVAVVPSLLKVVPCCLCRWWRP
jgi:hypothetical protein